MIVALMAHCGCSPWIAASNEAHWDLLPGSIMAGWLAPSVTSRPAKLEAVLRCLASQRCDSMKVQRSVVNLARLRPQVAVATAYSFVEG